MRVERVPYQVFIVDDMPEVREALHWALEEITDIIIVGEAGDGHTAIAQITALLPDIVLLDIELPGTSGYTIARSLKTLPQPPLVIFLSVHGDATARQRALDAGGDAFVEKSAGWGPLIEQIRHMLGDTDNG